MKILYLAQWFATPDEPGLGRAYELGKSWTRMGHQVHIVTGCVDHMSLTEYVPRPKPHRSTVTEVDGMLVERVWSTNGGQRGLWYRAGLFGSFGLCASLIAGQGPAPDLVIASSPPTTVGLAGLVLARRFQVPLVYELRDLWPDFLLACGAMEPGMSSKLIARLESLCRGRASGLMATSPGARAALEALGHGSDRIFVLSHGVDDFMDQSEPPRARHDRACLRGVFVGNQGRFHRVGDLLDACARIRDRVELELVVVGDGDERLRLEQRARELVVPNVSFAPTCSRRTAFGHMLDADVCFLCAPPDRYFDAWLPNKVFDYLASGTPILAAARGELRALIRDSGGGMCVEPGEPAELADAIVEFAALPLESRRAMGARGRAWVRSRFLRRHQAREAIAWLEGMRAP